MSFERKLRRAWAADPNRPRACTCSPQTAPGPDDAVLLVHRPWCHLRGVAGIKPGAVVLSVRGPGYGEPGYGGKR